MDHGASASDRGWSGYRYGFQDQEQDNELWEGAVTFKYRVEDARLGRFFSVDPLAAKYPYYSTYQFSGNRLIDMKELEGLEPTPTADPTNGISKRTARNLEKYDRKERRLANRENLTVKTDESRERMNEKYGMKRWYYSKVDRDRSSAGQGEDSDHFFAISELAHKRDLFNAAQNAPPLPPVQPVMININIGGPNAQTDPLTGRIEMTMPIFANGTVQTSIQFQGGTGSDNATMWITQSTMPFGKTIPINGIQGETLSGQNTTQNGAFNNVNFANGGFLTVQISGALLGNANSIVYSINVNQGMLRRPAPNQIFIVETISIPGDGNWDTSAGLNRKTRHALYEKLLKE